MLFKLQTAKGKLQMPIMEDYFPRPESKHFRAGDFDKEISVTIKSIDKVDFTNDGVMRPKPVLSFNETPKQLVVNRTNFSALSLMFGENTDDWPGAKIALAPAMTEFKGSRVQTIRVKRAPQPKQPFNDEVPF
jgi:hypothetical protein